MKDKQSLNKYFVKILDGTSTIKRIDHKLIPNLEEITKHKVAERVYDVDLKRELRRVAKGRTVSAFELKEHAETWFSTQGSFKKSSSHESDSKEESSTSSVQTSEMTNTDTSSVIVHQHKQLGKFTTMIQQISKTTQNSSLPGSGRWLVCYTCGKSCHICRNCCHREDRSSLNL